ncbi:hypothetical protein GALL_532900 [mine drainage metagenome]|uniref:Uncharacterized protein n=1 Tax=mine drainage metagenome TaxID=410659 RepID=A0A1J5P0T7_9ZZZZ
MTHIRGLAVWLGAPLFASLLCTVVWHIVSGGRFMDWRPWVAIGLMSLIFTFGGSTILALLFSAMTSRSIVYRYLFLVVFGVTAGGTWTLFLGVSPTGVEAGAIYGFVTACVWVALHRLIYRSRA